MVAVRKEDATPTGLDLFLEMRFYKDVAPTALGGHEDGQINQD